MIVPGTRPLWQPGVGAQIDRTHPAAQGLKSCWLFNENTGNMGYDAMGTRHFAFTGGVARIATPGGPGVKFDGTSGQGITPGHPLANATALTVILYVRQKDGLSAPYGPYLGSEQNYNTGIYIGDNNPGKIQFYIGTVDNDLPIPNDTWCQCAFTYNSVTNKKFAYLNGVQKIATTSTFGVMPNYQNTYIGKTSPGGGGYFTDSQIGYIKVWDREFSQAEILHDYVKPWAMFQPTNERRFLALAAAGRPVSPDMVGGMQQTTGGIYG
jgi:hypothetical protein